MDEGVEGPARRFLHVCYCCADVDTVAGLLAEGVGLHVAMRTTGERTSGAILGLERDVETPAAFVFDRRGPRAGPAVEIQAWVDPPLAGEPAREPHHVGLRAFGLLVSDLEALLSRLPAFGWAIAGRAQSAIFAGSAATVYDPNGVTIDLVESPTLPDGESRMRHLRVTCSDRSRSVEWYQGLGFQVVAEVADITDGSAFGLGQPVKASATRLRLPEDPFEVVLTEWVEPRGYGQHYGSPNRAGLYRYAVRVDDTRASYDALSGAGWRFDRPPMLVHLAGTPVPDMWITFVSDPDGIPVELVQRPASAFR